MAVLTHSSNQEVIQMKYLSVTSMLVVLALLSLSTSTLVQAQVRVTSDASAAVYKGLAEFKR